MELVDTNSVDLMNGISSVDDVPVLKKMKMEFDFPVIMKTAEWKCTNMEPWKKVSLASQPAS